MSSKLSWEASKTVKLANMYGKSRRTHFIHKKLKPSISPKHLSYLSIKMGHPAFAAIYCSELFIWDLNWNATKFYISKLQTLNSAGLIVFLIFPFLDKVETKSSINSHTKSYKSHPKLGPPVESVHMYWYKILSNGVKISVGCATEQANSGSPTYFFLLLEVFPKSQVLHLGMAMSRVPLLQ